MQVETNVTLVGRGNENINKHKKQYQVNFIIPLIYFIDGQSNTTNVAHPNTDIEVCTL